MVHELSITKEDIVQWTQQAIDAIIARSIASGKLNLEAAMNSALDRQITKILQTNERYYADKLADRILERAAKQLVVSLRKQSE